MTLVNKASRAGKECRPDAFPARQRCPTADPACDREAGASITSYRQIALTKFDCHVIAVLQRSPRSQEATMGGGAGVEGVQGARYDLEELAPTRRQVAYGYFRRRCSAAHGRRAPPCPPPGVGAGESNRGGEAD